MQVNLRGAVSNRYTCDRQDKVFARGFRFLRLLAYNGRGSRTRPKNEGGLGRSDEGAEPGTGLLCIAGAAPFTAKPLKGPTYSAHHRKWFFFL